MNTNNKVESKQFWTAWIAVLLVWLAVMFGMSAYFSHKDKPATAQAIENVYNKTENKGCFRGKIERDVKIDSVPTNFEISFYRKLCDKSKDTEAAEQFLATN